MSSARVAKIVFGRRVGIAVSRAMLFSPQGSQCNTWEVAGDVLINPIDDSRAPDVVGHLRRISKVALPAAAVAIVAGLVALLGLTQLKPTYTATVTAQIDAQVPVVSGDAYLYQMSAPYLALATSHEVRQMVAHEMGIAWDEERVGDEVKVNMSRSPLLLEVSGTAPNREQALKLAVSTVEALDKEARTQRNREIERAVAGPTSELTALQQQLADIDRIFVETYGYSDPTAGGDPRRAQLETRIGEVTAQINRIRELGVNGLSVLSAPDQLAVAEAVPLSKAIAVFVALVAFIVSAEAMVFARGRFGSRLTSMGAERIARTHGMSIETRELASTGFPPVTAGVIARRSSRNQKSMVVTTLCAEAMVSRWIDRDEHGDLLQLESIASNWPAKLGDSIGLVILVACVGEQVRSTVAEAARTVEQLGIPSRLVILALPGAKAVKPDVEVGAES